MRAGLFGGLEDALATIGTTWTWCGPGSRRSFGRRRRRAAQAGHGAAQAPGLAAAAAARWWALAGTCRAGRCLPRPRWSSPAAEATADARRSAAQRHILFTRPSKKILERPARGGSDRTRISALRTSRCPRPRSSRGSCPRSVPGLARLLALRAVILDRYRLGRNRTGGRTDWMDGGTGRAAGQQPPRWLGARRCDQASRTGTGGRRAAAGRPCRAWDTGSLWISVMPM